MSRRCRPPLPLAVLSLALLQAHGASAQGSGSVDAPIVLKRTPELTEVIPPLERGQRPSFVDGDRISGRPDLETVVEGNASLRRGDTVIRADRLEYYAPDDLAKATGRVHVNKAGNEYEGPELQLKLESFEGFFNSVRYRFLENGGHGDAERIDFVDQNRSVARQATYTTCRREDFPGWMPAWVLSAATLRTDSEENVGVAENARLSFMGVSTPPLPSVSFPLSSKRKSGILPPTIGSDSVNGLELTLPYYWNIAPNRDATITPTLMAKRGVNVSTEFRYLEEDYSGEVRLDVMPDDKLPRTRYNDKVREHYQNVVDGKAKLEDTPLLGAPSRTRWGLWTRHQHTFDAKSLGLDSLSGYVNINRVSDDDYWRDFGRTPSFTTRLLPSEGALNWGVGDFDGQVRALKYQTLKYDLSPILPPYDRLPQITANYNKYNWNGFDFSVNTDFTAFRGRPIDQRQPNADRAYALVQLSRPFITPSSFVIPKVQLHTTSYQFKPLRLDDSITTTNGVPTLVNYAGAPGVGLNSANVTVPTFSLDSGLTFERDASFFGRAFRQTLEPRAFYTYTPYRDQSRLPVYDTAANDFNFATIYTENAFSGHDRIADNNSLTVGLTSRLIDPDTGAEAVRLGIAQRRRFSDQRVTMPGGKAITDRTSDLLLGAQINWSPTWSTDVMVQYNEDRRRSERTAISARYTPGPYRSLTAAYRYQAENTPISARGTESIDLAWQWPLNDLWGDKGKNLGPGRGEGGGRWYTMGRLNYSMREKKMTDSVIGLEYDGCCWIGRIVYERLSTGLATTSKRIMFQIEFVGFASVGSSPARTLRQNVPRYQPLRQPVPGPSRFTNYD